MQSLNFFAEAPRSTVTSLWAYLVLAIPLILSDSNLTLTPPNETFPTLTNLDRSIKPFFKFPLREGSDPPRPAAQANFSTKRS